MASGRPRQRLAANDRQYGLDRARQETAETKRASPFVLYRSLVVIYRCLDRSSGPRYFEWEPGVSVKSRLGRFFFRSCHCVLHDVAEVQEGGNRAH